MYMGIKGSLCLCECLQKRTGLALSLVYAWPTVIRPKATSETHRVGSHSASAGWKPLSCCKHPQGSGRRTHKNTHTRTNTPQSTICYHPTLSHPGWGLRRGSWGGCRGRRTESSLSFGRRPNIQPAERGQEVSTVDRIYQWDRAAWLQATVAR